MKNIIKSLFVALMITMFSYNVSAYVTDKGENVSCDQYFEGSSHMLRYEKAYPFEDEWHNLSNKDQYIWHRSIKYKNGSYFDMGGAYDWTNELRNNGYKIDAGKSMKIFSTTGNNWMIDRKPTKRTNATRNSHDFAMSYTVTYDYDNKANSGDEKKHTECGFYSVTWCGDGVVDAGYETCDPEDASKSGWGNAGCSNSCAPIEVDPVCKVLTIPAPTTILAPASKVVSCTGTNAKTIKIDCGNGQTQVFDGKMGDKTVSTTCNYTNAGTYQAKCFVDDTYTNNQCMKTVNVTTTNPKITIIKEDSNGFDRDGGDYDTQTVMKGDFAMFKIKVKNSGNEDFKSIVLSDQKAPNCAGTVLSIPSNPKPGVWVDYQISGLGNHSDNILQVGEIIEYRCKKTNTQTSYTNTASVSGIGVTSGKTKNDKDTTRVKIMEPVGEPVCTGLDVDKTSGKVSFVSKFNCTGDNVDTYKMEVKNASGTVLSTINSNTGEYNFTTVGTYTVSCYMNDETTTESICKKTIVANDDTIAPSIKITKLDANIVGDKDTHVGDDSQTVVKNKKAVFSILVENNGTEDLNTIVLTDEIAPNCAGSIILPSTTPSTFSNFTVAGEGNHNDAILQPGETFEYTCEKANTIINYINVAKVDAKGVTSKKPVNSTDDTKVIIEGTTGPKIEIIKYSKNDADLDGNITHTEATDDTQTVNSGTKAVFEIKVTNSGDEDLIDVVVTDIRAPLCDRTFATLAIGESETYTCEKANTTANYTNVAKVDGKGKNSSTPVLDEDDTKIVVKTGTGVNHPRGGSHPQCYNIEQSGNEYTCTVNKKTWKSGTVGIACNGVDFDQIATRSSGLSKNSKGKYVATFTCDTSVIDPAKLPKCDVQNGTVNANQIGWGTTPTQCKIQTTKECGNGKVEPSIGEQCDGGASCYAPGTAKECKLKSRGGTTTKTDCMNSTYAAANEYKCGLKTYPSGGELSVTSIDNYLVGSNQVFTYDDDPSALAYGFKIDNTIVNYLRIENIGDEALHFPDKLCVVNTDSSGIIVGNRACNTQIIGWVYPGESSYYRESVLNLDVFKGNPSTLGTKTSDTAKLALTILDLDPTSSTYNTTLEWSPILSGDMNITVAKPTIANRGGGLSYIKNGGDLSSVDKIVEAVNKDGNSVVTIQNTDQQNFVATVLGDGGDLSDVDALDSNLKDKAEIEGEKYKEKSISEVIVDTTTPTTPFAKYRGLSNVYSKSGDITIDSLANLVNQISDISSISESMTFIIDGNLTITGDIISNKNIAFIVKNGDIIIDSQVTDITGTYISIGGEIRERTLLTDTDKKELALTVNGSLYGNLKGLTDNRKLIEMDSDGNINVGTIISYGSNLLNKPAPLVGQFINESIKAQKIAQ